MRGREREWQGEKKREKEKGCMWVYEWMHTMHFLRALLHLYVLHVCIFVFLFVSLLLCFQLSNFPLRSSLSPHLTNSLKRTFRILLVRPLLFSSVQLTPHISDIPSSPKSSNRTNVKSGVSALSSTSTAFGTAASNARLDQTGNGHIDEALRQQALAEEEAAMNQYKVLDKFLAIELLDSAWFSF